jgi:hypothetical protein
MVNITSDATWERVKYSCAMVMEFTKNVENIRSLPPLTQRGKNTFESTEHSAKGNKYCTVKVLK